MALLSYNRGVFRFSKGILILCVFFNANWLVSAGEDAANSGSVLRLSQPYLAEEVLPYLMENPDYDHREYWKYSGEKLGGGDWDHLTREQREAIFHDVVEDVSSLVKLHLDDSCEEYFVKRTRDEISGLSRVLALFGAVYTFDPELAAAWTHYWVSYDDAGWWARRKQRRGLKNMGKAFQRACYLDGFSVEDAAATILGGPAAFE
ncbi:hypothetical protein E2F43_18290 [Seongchinamella unica]|uniref:Uncharacterized protein n=1 Tax=Seongchinamella unica TaxID=2547392 RepID=A0A4R5LN74_9GAMM|nr:hypothetical protein [Seongchinamella unica]TDG11661.1 hypothetical protein E2F43_18290 [Seongchinamella unica]